MAPNTSNSTDNKQVIYKKHSKVGNGTVAGNNLDDVANNNVNISKKTIENYEALLPSQIGTDHTFKRKIVWFNAIGFLILHIGAIYGIYLGFTQAHILTFVWCLVVLFGASEGVTIGAHRMYSHKALKGAFLTRLVLVTLQTIAGQNCMYIWVRDHRQHHKYSDTDADPHNATRGFFFSHIGWLMSRKHPAVIAKGKSIDMSDLEADPIVMIQKIFYKPLYMVFALALPVAIPVYFWNETYWNSFFVAYLARYIIQLNGTWLVNSAAHMFGYKPYDKNILPVETRFVDLISFGEGWHNYHHAFPWDYRAAELGLRLSPTTIIIDLLAFFGLVYDLKLASKSLVERKCKNLGDGTHPTYKKDCVESKLINSNLYKLKNISPVENEDEFKELQERGF